MTDIFATSDVSFLDMAANQAALGQKIAEQMKPAFAALGLELDQFVVENISLPEELQKVMDQRIGMSMAGDLGRYTQFEAAQSLADRRGQPGGAAGMGVGLGAGAAMAQAVMAAIEVSLRAGSAHRCRCRQARSSASNAASPFRSARNSVRSVERPNELSILRRAHAP